MKILGALLGSLLAVATATAAPNAPAANCAAFAASKLVTDFEAKYALLKNLPYALWDQYRPETQTVMLTGLKTSANCAVVLRDGARADVLTLELPLTIQNGFYTFEYIGGNGNSGLQIYLRTSGVNRAVVVNIDATIGILPAPNELLTGYNHFDLDLTVHEGFHLNLLFAKMMKHADAPMWPDWDQQPNRSKVGELCYNSAAAKPLVERELKALLKAVKLGLLHRRFDLARQAAREFIAQRTVRYATLAEVRVPSYAVKDGISCAQAEAIMELEEGMADFVGSNSVHKLGLINDAQLIEHLSGEGDSDLFYRFGNAQMTLVHAMKGAEISTITGRIARSAKWEDGVHAEFVKAITE